MSHIAEGLRQSGRSREGIEIYGGGFVATGEDEEAVPKMLDAVRYRVAFYGSTRTYFPVWELYGLEDLGLKLHKMVADRKWDKIANEVSDDVVVERMLARGRDDDNEATIRNRLKVYHEETQPVADFYGDKLLPVDAEGSVEEINERAMKALGK